MLPPMTPPRGSSKGMVHSSPQPETTSWMLHIFFFIIIEVVFKVEEEEGWAELTASWSTLGTRQSKILSTSYHPPLYQSSIWCPPLFSTWYRYCFIIAPASVFILNPPARRGPKPEASTMTTIFLWEDTTITLPFLGVSPLLPLRPLQPWPLPLIWPRTAQRIP